MTSSVSLAPHYESKKSSPGRFPVPRSRALVTDILHIHQKSPNYAHTRRMQLREVAAARKTSLQRISWPAVFIRAWSEISSENPVLRQTWRQWPLRHVFQQQSTVASLATSRQHDNRDWLFWGLIRSPETQSLRDIQIAIDRFKNEPPEREFARQLTLSRFPTFVRRIIWWWNLHIAGEKRGKRLGTFSLTTVAGKGVEIQLHPTVTTTGLTFGPIDQNGQMKVTLVYDHRLMDGSYVADRLHDLEQKLNGSVLSELTSLADTSTHPLSQPFATSEDDLNTKKVA